MEIVDLNEAYYPHYFCCLENWSEEIKEAGDGKKIWFDRMKGKGLRVKLAIIDGEACGMIQYLPVEHTWIEGEDLCFITCIWVHGYKQGVGNHQRKGIGKALLAAAESDIGAMGKKGVAAWGVSLPFWMKASWFRKQGYRRVDTYGMAVLMWKPLIEDARPPRWIRAKKKPQAVPDRVTVTSFVNGWCPAQNIVFERAKRAAAELGERVDFQEIRTSDPETFAAWGINDALFIDGKAVSTGPPPSYKKIRKKIAKRVRRIRP